MEDYSRYTNSFWRNNPAERKAIITEHIKRAKQGAEAWNQWAEKYEDWKEGKDESLLITFQGAEIPKDVRFEGFKFTGDVNFHKATFSGNADFRGATFTDADFRGATFTGNAYFLKATFTGNANFSGARFTGDAYFSGARFTGDAYFSGARFTGDAYFSGARFTGDAYFSGATFTGNAYFSGATFTGNAYFSGATFTGNAHFSEATFTDADFRGATFTDAHFRGATFTDADFRGATFTYANFSEATFTYANFSEARFTGDANFSGATFSGDANFINATFTGNAHFIKTSFLAKSSLAFFPKKLIDQIVEEASFADENEAKNDDMAEHSYFEVTLPQSRVSATNLFYLIRGMTATYNNYYYLCTTTETDEATIQRQLANTYQLMDAKNELYISAVKQGSTILGGIGLHKIIPSVIDAGTKFITAFVDSVNNTRQTNMDVKEREQAIRHNEAKHALIIEAEMEGIKAKKLANAEASFALVKLVEADQHLIEATASILDGVNFGDIAGKLPIPQSVTVIENLEPFTRQSSYHLANAIAKNVSNDNIPAFKLVDKEEKT